MKLVRLKITDPNGFRSLQAGFEYRFRTDWALQDEFSEQPKFAYKGFAPFVCAGPNGSGKSNLLEALAVIFFNLKYYAYAADNFCQIRLLMMGMSPSIVMKAVMGVKIHLMPMSSNI
ncbi:hypothetical protein GCM10025856_13230 [Methylophaga marina]|uniref:hypothetical protein n=1 Tax=Methylophaga marina TaxID=45495 RepID=UPI002572DEC7|nr:hypothetical protein [Methylophaga marina]BDZ73604.1 hypothetical protein GCM10025856_13230 [Methylophaga marina]